jgi:retron-type reverse transcriptase
MQLMTVTNYSWSVPLNKKADHARERYRRGHSTKDAMRKVWKEIWSGREWIVDADLKDFFDSIDRNLLMWAARKHTSPRGCSYTSRDGWRHQRGWRMVA